MTRLCTNLARKRFSFETTTRLYRFRWQVELCFKEWKSYANLHAFTSTNASLVEGLIWASLCAAALKRALAHAAQRSRSSMAISTRIVAMCGVHILPDLLRSALQRFAQLESVLADIFRYLWDNAQRAHPQRDRLRGRMQAGLEYVGVKA